jgi:hypothetical protein
VAVFALVASASIVAATGAYVLGEGYASSDDYYWVCRPCFDDFREAFRRTVTRGVLSTAREQEET